MPPADPSSVHNLKKESLSLCMIVKNEEAVIRRCLESVREIVDEMIIVDTGSDDKTIEICHAFGARVLKYEWDNDFAAARNFGLKHAAGDWIMWLDADEEIDASDAPKLRDLMGAKNADAFSLCLINYCTETPNLDDSFQISQLRIFRNHRGILFEGKIHESLNLGELEKTINLPVRIHHYGYMPEVMKSKEKHSRNLRMLLRELAKNDDCSPWVYYHIASEYYNAGHLYVALKQLNLGILNFILSGFKPPSMCYRLKYSILLQLKETENALQTVDKAISIYPDYVDMYFLKGQLLIEQKKYAEAETVFGHCISLGEHDGEHLTQKGVGSFRAWYYYGLCLEERGQFKEALTAYERSLSISPDFRQSGEAYSTLKKGIQDMMPDV